MPLGGNCCETLVEVVAKVLCIGVLVAQQVLLDTFFFNLDAKGTISPVIWVLLDMFVTLWWICSLAMPMCLKTCLRKLPRKLLVALSEVRFAYLSWVLYAALLCLKINHMFFFFAEDLPMRPQLFSSTGLKLTLSMAGVVFLLLAYCHHKELKGVYYKLTMEKVAFSACLDVLDALMLLDFLFIRASGILITPRLDRIVRAFSCICIILPTFPLLVLRCIQTPTPKHKLYRIMLIIQSLLYLLLVNFPLFSIRLHFWFTHNRDISTFFTKNVIMLFKGVLEIIKESMKLYKQQSSTSYMSDDPDVATRLKQMPTKDLGKEDV